MPRRKKPVEAAETGPAEVATPEPAAAPPGAAASGPKAADPIGVQSIALTGGNDGPKVRLLRSNTFQQMRIQFDEKPPEAVRERLHAAGWKWRGGERVWTKQLDRDARWRTQADAERLVQEIANALRADNGLPPTADLGRG